MRRLIAISIAPLLPLGAACGGDDDSMTALEGLYQLASWTHNPDGCDGEGPPAVEEATYSHFFIRDDSFTGDEIISAVMCGDLEECRNEAADSDTRYGGIVFYSGSDDEGWKALDSILSPSGETCRGQVFASTLTGEAGSAVRIDREARSVTDIPLDDTGECQVGADFQQAESLPCEELTVVMGTFLEEI